MAKKEVTGYKAAELAEELGITPAVLRQHLRALKVEKPEAGWVWPKKTDNELTQIRKDVKARMKELEAGKEAKAKEKAAAKAAKAKGEDAESSEETKTPAKKTTRSQKAKK